MKTMIINKTKIILQQNNDNHNVLYYKAVVLA